MIPVLLVLAGCAMDLEDEALSVDESAIQYCGDEPCEPYEPPPPPARPDLAASGGSCDFVYANYPPHPYYKLPFRVKNIGTAHIGATTARVGFKISYTGFVTAPTDITIPALAPGETSYQWLEANPACYLQLPGCDITVTANHNGMWVEATRANNAATWHCRKPS